MGSRSPYGERGLKEHDAQSNQWKMMSLPVRGAWIESTTGGADPPEVGSLPVRGAWIESATWASAGYIARGAPRTGGGG